MDKLKKVLYGEVINNDPNSLIKSSKSQRGLDEEFKEQVKTVLNNTNADNKEEAREKLQYRVINKFLNSKKIPDDIKEKNKDLFKKFTKTEGSGMKKGRIIFGRGLVNNDKTPLGISEPPKAADKYIKLGKYKANKDKLLGGKLQVRSENNNQVNNVN